jgi:4-carboxymuconolactone decarboxylase
MHQNAPEGERHFQRYLSANCFGDHLTRTGIDLAHRELLTSLCSSPSAKPTPR